MGGAAIVIIAGAITTFAGAQAYANPSTSPSSSTSSASTGSTSAAAPATTPADSAPATVTAIPSTSQASKPTVVATKASGSGKSTPAAGATKSKAQAKPAAAGDNPKVTFSGATYSPGTVKATFKGSGFAPRGEGADVVVSGRTCPKDPGETDCEQYSGAADANGNFSFTLSFNAATCPGNADWTSQGTQGGAHLGSGSVTWQCGTTVPTSPSAPSCTTANTGNMGATSSGTTASVDPKVDICSIKLYWQEYVISKNWDGNGFDASAVPQNRTAVDGKTVKGTGKVSFSVPLNTTAEQYDYNGGCYVNRQNDLTDVSQTTVDSSGSHGTVYTYVLARFKVSDKPCGYVQPKPKDASASIVLTGVCGSNNDVVHTTAVNATAGTPVWKAGVVSVVFTAKTGHLFGNGQSTLTLTHNEVNTSACPAPPKHRTTPPAPTPPSHHHGTPPGHFVTGGDKPMGGSILVGELLLALGAGTAVGGTVVYVRRRRGVYSA